VLAREQAVGVARVRKEAVEAELKRLSTPAKEASELLAEAENRWRAAEIRKAAERESALRELVYLQGAFQPDPKEFLMLRLLQVLGAWSRCLIQFQRYEGLIWRYGQRQHRHRQAWHHNKLAAGQDE
jgi:hypothetical protein